MRERAGSALRGLFAAALIGATFPVAVAVPPVCAGEGDRAALVVDTGTSELSFCVTLPDGGVSGLDLIVLAHQQHDLDYRFGFGGEAVCMLAGVGAEGDDCFERYPDFWGYWRGDGSGGWQWSGTGAGSTRVEDGDVEGWAWGSGSDGSTHPAPPATTFGSVCAAQSPPSEPRDEGAPEGENDARRGGSRGTTARAQSPAAAPVTVRPDRGKSRGGAPGAADRAKERGARRDRPERGRSRWWRMDALEPGPAASAPGDVLPAVARGDAGRDTDGPPAAGLAAVAATGLVAFAGVVLGRRRRRTSAADR